MSQITSTETKRSTSVKLSIAFLIGTAVATALLGIIAFAFRFLQ